MILVSFDIDGTLEVGDPPGVITLDLVRRSRALGYLIGSSSDRVVSDQQRLWQRAGIEMDFIGHKHKLDEVRARFPQATRLIHIGDGDADQIYAVKHGFEFHWVYELPASGTPGWIW